MVFSLNMRQIWRRQSGRLNALRSDCFRNVVIRMRRMLRCFTRADKECIHKGSTIVGKEIDVDGGCISVGKLLGSGTFGSVYSSTPINFSADNVLGTVSEIAVKAVTFRDNRFSNHTIKSYAEREGRIHASVCEHENIIDLYQVFRNRSGFFFAMELAKGPNLQEYLQSRAGGIQEVEVLKISLQLCQAVNHIHSIGYAHRDIKPDNILLSSISYQNDVVPHIKLSDFGLACKYREKKRLITKRFRNVVGTPGFMAPELFMANCYNYFKADIWSIGATMFQIITGTLPYECGSSSSESICCLSRDSDGVNSNGWISTSDETKKLIENLLSERPSDRYSAKEACSKIEELLGRLL